MSVPLYQSGGSGSSLATPVSLANGGTHADLSATGGTSQIVKQSSVGGDLSVALLTATEMPVLSAAQGMGYFFGPGRDIAGTGGTATIISPSGNNVLQLFQFVLPYRITISRIVFSKGATVVAGSTANCGIYDVNKNLKIDSGAFDTSAGGAATQTKTITAVTLDPGVYWFAQAATDSTVTSATNITGYGGTSNTALVANSPANNARTGQAANTLSAGALPATLGNITSNVNRAPIAAMFEP